MHESGNDDAHELYLLCESIEAFMAEMQRHGIPASPPVNQGWGTLTEVVLPGGGKRGVYQPHHARPKAAASRKAPKRKAPTKKTTTKKAKTPAKKSLKKATTGKTNKANKQ